MELEKSNYSFLSGGGDMGMLIREKDWKTTPLGDPQDWPQSLRTMVSMIMDNPFGMYIAWGKEYTQIYNDSYRPILGSNKHPYALGASTRETFSEIWHIIEEMFDGVMQGTPVGFPDLMLPLNRNGFVEECYFDFSYSPIRKENGEVGGVLVTVIETTGKKKVEDALKLSEERFRTMADNIPNLAWMANADGWIYWYNQKWHEYTGTTPKQMEGWGWQSVHDPKELPSVLIKWNESILTGHPFEMIFPLKSANGEFRQFLTRVLPVKNNENEIIHWFGTNTDITAQKEIEEELKLSEGRFRIMVEQAPVGICVLRSKDFIVEVANPRILEIWGKDAQQMMNNPIFEGLPDAAGQGFETLLKDVFTTGKPFIGNEYPLFVQRNGKIENLFVNFVYEPLYDTGNKIDGVIAVAIEVTEQVIAKQKIKENADKLQTVLESLPQMAWTTLPTGEANYFSQSWYDYTGQTEEDALGFGWTTVVHSDYIDITLSAWQNALVKGTSLEVENKVKGKDGNYRWMWVKGTPIKSDQGGIIQWVGTVTDINERKSFSEELKKQVQERTMELETKNSELKKMNKELESFAYISSHDLQEPLRKIQTFSTLLIDKESDQLSEKGKEQIKRMKSAAERMQTLINDLLTYSRTNLTRRNFEKIKLSEIVDELRTELKEELDQKNATMECIGSCEVDIIPFQFRQLLHNLISNSLKFSKPTVPLHILIKSKMVVGVEIDNIQFLENDHYCHIRFSDNGIGFEPQYGSKIFELFQRLHGREEYGGTGIGLAIVKKIVENHNGYITASGELGIGATFDIYIPSIL